MSVILTSLPVMSLGAGNVAVADLVDAVRRRVEVAGVHDRHDGALPAKAGEVRAQASPRLRVVPGTTGTG